MSRIKFIPVSITTGKGAGQGFQTNPVTATTPQYLDSLSVRILADGSLTMLIDATTGDQIHINKTYTAAILAIDSASADDTVAIDLT